MADGALQDRQEHLKRFEKTDTRTRGELVARVFFADYLPRIEDGAPLDEHGAFADLKRHPVTTTGG
jgi:hypothetical protein